MPTAIDDNLPRLLTREQAAAYLSIKPQTLAVWQSTGRYGIPVVKVGRAVRYDRASLDEWIATRTRRAGVDDRE